MLSLPLINLLQTADQCQFNHSGWEMVMSLQTASAFSTTWKRSGNEVCCGSQHPGWNLINRLFLKEGLMYARLAENSFCRRSGPPVTTSQMLVLQEYTSTLGLDFCLCTSYGTQFHTISGHMLYH